MGAKPRGESKALIQAAIERLEAGATLEQAIADPRERPILFSGPMVRAILGGKKTQTRRLYRERPGDVRHRGRQLWQPPSPYGVRGDRLWVRETHAQFAVGNRRGVAPQCVAYRATCDAEGGFEYVNNGDEIMRLQVTKWTPAIHMPRWASRITLEVTGVRVERLRALSEEDAIAEGISVLPLQDVADHSAWWQSAPGEHQSRTACGAFARLWDDINGKRAPWASNPWVWVVEFRRVA